MFLEKLATKRGRRYLGRFVCDICNSEYIKPIRTDRPGKDLCGCSPWNRMHDQTAMREYGVWKAMIARCEDSTNLTYRNYGGRGVKVDSTWSVFNIFLADMGQRPPDKHTLERLDNSKGYGPDNCIWATRHTQSRNMRRNIWVSVNGERLCSMDAVHKVGVPPRSYFKYKARGMSPAESLLFLLRKRDHGFDIEDAE